MDIRNPINVESIDPNQGGNQGGNQTQELRRPSVLLASTYDTQTNSSQSECLSFSQDMQNSVTQKQQRQSNNALDNTIDFATQPAISLSQPPQVATATDDQLVSQTYKVNSRRIERTTIANQRRKSTPLMGALFGSTKSGNGKLVTYLLATSLVITLFNVLLLSSIVKRIRLADGESDGDGHSPGSGYLSLSGKIVWNELEPMGLGGALLKLPTRLAPGKSIALKTIKSSTPNGQQQLSRPLKLEIDDSGGGLRELTGGSSSGHLFLLANGGPRSSSSLNRFAQNSDKLSSDHNHEETRDEDLDNDKNEPTASVTRQIGEGKSNYLAVNARANLKSQSAGAAAGSADGDMRFGLEFGTSRRFKLELLAGSQSNARGTNKLMTQGTGGSVLRKNLYSQSDSSYLNSNPKTMSSPLFEFDGEQQSISLALETKLNTKKPGDSDKLASSSDDATVRDSIKSTTMLNIEGTLSTNSEITGLLGSDLEVQVRNGSLHADGLGRVRLVSRAGGVQLGSYDCVEFVAPAIELDAKRLYLTRGIKYLDSPDFKGFPGKKLATNTGQISELNQGRRSAIVANQNNSPIRAYNLVEASGILMAA